MSRPRLALVVVAAGAGTRMQGVDKMWADLGGHPVVAHPLRRLAPAADETILVVRRDAVGRAESQFSRVIPELRVVAGGSERTDSVLNGLRATDNPDFVAVHDGARPFASPALLDQGRALLRRCDGAVPAVPVHDTLKRIDEEGFIESTVERSHLRAAQTPQLFRAGPLAEAYQAYESGNHRRVTDEASLLEAVGCIVATFPGSPLNFKITTALDLQIARLLLASGTESA